jgi:transposase-like protein
MAVAVQSAARRQPERHRCRASPLSLRDVEDALSECGIDIQDETVRHWWARCAPTLELDTRRRQLSRMRGFRQ